MKRLLLISLCLLSGCMATETKPKLSTQVFQKISYNAASFRWYVVYQDGIEIKSDVLFGEVIVLADLDSGKPMYYEAEKSEWDGDTYIVHVHSMEDIDL